ncbi:GtrA family protein [Nocardioides sp. NPDC101246]|uniref:GtrA family protein n=1 Tax=Nocardioides sp. NPDC101246 TaxID=3364336 RepID=UPI0038228D34
MTVASSWRHRALRLLGEVVRFMVVGGLATVVSFVGFNALAHGLLLGTAPLRSAPIVAYVVANIVAGVVAYVGTRLWAFRDRDAPDQVTGVVRFFVLGALTMAIPVVCLWISRYVLGLSSPLADNVSANVIGLGISTATRFWVFRRFVFNQPVVREPSRPAA